MVIMVARSVLSENENVLAFCGCDDSQTRDLREYKGIAATAALRSSVRVHKYCSTLLHDEKVCPPTY